MIIDYLEQTIPLKVCYFGPALSGKTTSIKALFKHFGLNDQILSIESSVQRTLFFDYGTISFQNNKWKLKIHLYSTTGQDFYIITRPITLSAIDGLIFVIDSEQDVYYRNLTSWNELCNYFEDSITKLPKVLAFNKQDLQDKFEPNQFLEHINYFKYKNIECRNTVATTGEGILDCFEDLLGLIFKNLYKTQLVSLVN